MQYKFDLTINNLKCLIMLVLITEIKEKTKEKKEKNILIEKAGSLGWRIFRNKIFTRLARIDYGYLKFPLKSFKY